MKMMMMMATRRRVTLLSSSSFPATLTFTTSLLLLILFVLCHHPAGVNALFETPPSTSKYIGCYVDKREIKARSLPHGYFLNKQMTPQMCVDRCTAHGLPFAGLQWGIECWCGRSKPRWGTHPDGHCNVACGGNSVLNNDMCGGSLALSVWQHKDFRDGDDEDPLVPPLPLAPQYKISLDPQDRDRYRPLLALVMMLKNENHTIHTTLESVRDYIDVWYIIDTGSTDGTQKTIKHLLKGVPGELWEEPFIDWGATRNRIMDIANNSHPRPVFSLMLSADETVKNPADMRRFLQEQLYSFGNAHGAYPVIMNNGIDFDSLRLARVDDNWRYEGRVHEYLRAPDEEWHDLYRPTPEIRVQFAATDGDRRFNSQYKIAEILVDEVNKRPNHTRSLFYLARTFTHIQNYSGAFWAYSLLARATSWKDERYEALIHKAFVARSMARPWFEVHDLFLQAYEDDPKKVDALFEIMLHYMWLGVDHYQQAYIYAMHGLAIRMPESAAAVKNILLREVESMYIWRHAKQTAQLAQHDSIQDWVTCVRTANYVLLTQPGDGDSQRWRQKCLSKLPGDLEISPLYDHNGDYIHVDSYGQPLPKLTLQSLNAPLKSKVKKLAAPSTRSGSSSSTRATPAITSVIAPGGGGGNDNVDDVNATASRAITMQMLILIVPVTAFIFVWCVRRRKPSKLLQ